MINQDAVDGVAAFATRLNAGEFDNSPAFTTGQVNKNGIVVPLPDGSEPIRITVLEGHFRRAS